MTQIVRPLSRFDVEGILGIPVGEGTANALTVTGEEYWTFNQSYRYTGEHESLVRARRLLNWQTLSSILGMAAGYGGTNPILYWRKWPEEIRFDEHGPELRLYTRLRVSSARVIGAP